MYKTADGDTVLYLSSGNMWMMGPACDSFTYLMSADVGGQYDLVDVLEQIFAHFEITCAGKIQ